MRTAFIHSYSLVNQKDCKLSFSHFKSHIVFLKLRRVKFDDEKCWKERPHQLSFKTKETSVYLQMYSNCLTLFFFFVCHVKVLFSPNNKLATCYFCHQAAARVWTLLLGKHACISATETGDWWNCDPVWPWSDALNWLLNFFVFYYVWSVNKSDVNTQVKTKLKTLGDNSCTNITSIFHNFWCSTLVILYLSFICTLWDIFWPLELRDFSHWELRLLWLSCRLRVKRQEVNISLSGCLIPLNRHVV